MASKILTLLILLLLSIWSLWIGFFSSSFQNITPKEALALLKNDTNISLLDVRTVAEFKEGHLEGATLIPLEYLAQNLDMLEEVKNKKIVVYCRSGSRSLIGADILQKNGFTPINIQGGLLELIKLGTPLVK